jgi:Zn-dependent M28 family amino/carboxypeptidase
MKTAGQIATLLIALFIADTANADYLITFQRTNITDAQIGAGARVVAKLDNIALALIPSGNFARMQEIDETTAIIDQNCDIDLYWIAQTSGGGEINPLLKTEHFMILRLAGLEARRLIGRGVRLTKCMDLNLPPDKVIISTYDAQSIPILAIDIDSLMNLVSVDSVRSFVQRLQAFQTRYTGTDSCAAVGSWIMDKFLSWGFDVVEYQNFWVGDSLARNVIATKVGEVYPDKVIVIGGHYDSIVNDGGDPEIFAPGADDNATGAAMTLEIARIMADIPLKQTVRFAAFGAEEQGLYGSNVYVYYAIMDSEQIQLMINADMIGNVADSYRNFEINCNESGEPFGQILSQIASENTALIPELNVGEFYGSDHYPFDQAGFRIVYSEESDFSPNWHEQTDVIDSIDLGYCSDIVRSNLGLLALAASMPPFISDLRVTNAGDGESVYLSWEALPDSEISRYEVRYGLSENQLNLADTTYYPADTIRGLSDNTIYYFGVTAIDRNGNRGAMNQLVEIAVRSIPLAVDTLTVTPYPGEIDIEWSESRDPDFDHYQLWRRMGDEGDYIAYSEVTGDPFFIDQNLQSNMRYHYYVTVIDTTGLTSEPSISDYAKKVSFDSGILLVDEMNDGSGSQGQPTDAQQDSFYSYISQDCQVSFYDYAHQGALRINDIGPYSVIAWMDDDPSNHYLPAEDSHLARYLSYGGNLLFVGWRSLYTYSNARPYTFREDSFPYIFLNIEAVLGSSARDFIEAQAIAQGWPDLNVVPERVVPTFEGRLPYIDVLSFNDSVRVLYTFDSFAGDTTFEDKPVAFGINAGNCIYATFPLYVMGDEPARQFFAAAMRYFGEPVLISEDQEAGPLPRGFMAQNYPNPFNAETTIKFYIPEAGHIKLTIYNLLGQEIAILANEHIGAGFHNRVWKADRAASGIYFYRFSGEHYVCAGRMALLK